MQNSTLDYLFHQAYEDHRQTELREKYIDFNQPGTTLDIAMLQRQHPFKQKTLIVTFQGKLVTARVRDICKQPPERAKRGQITDFSAASRKRLFDLIHRLEITQRPIFITLTYGEEYPDAKTAKNHLRAFLERFRRAFSNTRLSCLWRMEFQKRGAPHFHLIFFGLPFIKKEKIQTMWGEIICMERPFTRIEQVRSHKSLMSYISKYVAKVNPGENSGFNSPSYLHAYRAKYGDNIGRIWGVFQRDNLPLAEQTVLELPYDGRAFHEFRSLAAHRYPPIADYLSLGFRLYVASAERWKDIFHHIYDVHF